MFTAHSIKLRQLRMRLELLLNMKTYSSDKLRLTYLSGQIWIIAISVQKDVSVQNSIKKISGTNFLQL